MKTKKQKTIIDSVENYEEARSITLAIVKAMAEKWPRETLVWEAKKGSTSPPRWRTWDHVIARNGGKK